MRIVLATDARRGDELRRILLGEGLTCDAADVVGYDGLPARLAEVPAELVLVICNRDGDECLEAIRAADRVTSSSIMAAGDPTDSQRMREAIRAGASEFLAIDRLREELTEAVLKIEADGQLPRERGTVIALFSPNGGAGVSTVAINLAARLAAKSASEIALVDLKPAPGDLSVMLDLQPKHSLDNVCRNWERLDRQLLAASMTPHRSGVHVLAQTGYPADGGLLENALHSQAIRQTITLLRRMYAVTILDLDHSLSPEQLEAMRLANFVGLVVRSDVPGLSRARWALDTAARFGLNRDRFRLVLNRFGSGSVGIDKIEETLGIKVFQSIPDDRRSMSRAMNRGIPVAELSRLSRISRSFSNLARNVRTARSAAL